MSVAVAVNSNLERVVQNAPWPIARLGDIAEFIMGQAPPGDASNFDQRGTIFVKAGEFGQLHPVVKEWTTKPLRYAKRGDVLICVVGATAGKLNLGIDCAIGRSVAAIRPTEQTYDRFVYLQLLPKVLTLRAGSTGSAQGVINRDMLANIQIVLPPLPEQRRIVAEIEKQFTRLEAGVAALRRVQANLKRYRAAVLKAACEGRLVPTEAELAKTGNRKAKFETGEALLARILTERRQNWQGRGNFVEPAAPEVTALPKLPQGWTWASAEQLCSTVASGSTPSADQLFQRDGEVPFIKVYNLTFGGPLDFSIKPTFISKVIHEGRLGRSKAFPGDVLTNIVGPPLGKVSIVPDRFPEWNINQAIVVFRPTEAISNRLLAFWLRSEGVLARLDHTAKATAGQFNIQVTTCRKLTLPVPPLAEQTRILAEVERRLSVVEELEAVVSADLQRAARLRQSILQKAFTGEL